MNSKWLLGVVLVFAMSAVANESEPAPEVSHEVLKPEVIRVREVPTDFGLPPQLWDALLSHSSVKEVKASVEGEEDEVKASTVLFASLTVRFREKNPGVLVSPMVDLVLPKGGGQIDLSKIITGEPGTFFVQFLIEENFSDPSFEAYHLSKARKRRFENRVYGGGCRSFAKITKIVKSPGDSRGMAFNTTKDLHISSLGGHFIFSWGEGDQITVTQVHFFDSEKPQYSCQANAEGDIE